MELSQDLKAVGFTEYEARVYLALLKESPATGYQISKKSGVPRSMVYEALGRLEGRGAVLKSEERRASHYRPVPPDTLLDRSMADYQAHVDQLRSGLQALFQEREDHQLWTITGRGAVLAEAARLIDTAAGEVLIVSSDPDLEALKGNLKAAADRGVSIGALLTGTASLGFGQVAHHPPLESELHEMTHMLVVVTDLSQALIANTERDVTATVTGSRNFVWITRQFVWMELFAQRIFARLGSELLDRLDPEDRLVLEVYAAS